MLTHHSLRCERHCRRQVRPARRLQMARPDRAVLQTKPPPPVGASAALEAAEAAVGRV